MWKINIEHLLGRQAHSDLHPRSVLINFIQYQAGGGYAPVFILEGPTEPIVATNGRKSHSKTFGTKILGYDKRSKHRACGHSIICTLIFDVTITKDSNTIHRMHRIA